MKTNLTIATTIIALFAALAIPARMSTQEERRRKKELPHYAITDLGTLGGKFSEGVGINNRGLVSGNSNSAFQGNGHASV